MMTPRSALFLAAAVALAIAMFPAASPVSAQEDTRAFGAPSCSPNFGNSVALDKKSFPLAAVPPAEIVQKSKPALSAGPFAGGKFPFDKVDIYLAEKDLGEENSEESGVALYVRAVRNQKESWFTIAHERTDLPESDSFRRTKGDTGPHDGIDKDSSPDTRGYLVPAAINAADRFADDAAPVFQVQALESPSNVSLWQATAKQRTFHEIV